MPGTRSWRLLVRTIVLVTACRAQEARDETTEESAKQQDQFPETIRVTSWNDMPYSGLTKTADGTWVGEGYAFYILDLISQKLNFTYTIVPPDSHVLGGENSGLLELLYKREVDLAVAFLPFLPQMERFCKFGTALDESSLTAVMKRPQESATGSGLLAPFDNTVWLLVLAAIFVVAPIIYVFALIRAHLWTEDSERFTLPSCLWFVYSSLLKQGTNIVANSDSTRILFATWWVFILILTSFYTANLTAFLTKPQFTLPIDSLKDIVSKGYKWVTLKGRTIDYLLAQPNENELSILNGTSPSRFKGEYIPTYVEPSVTIFKALNRNKLYLGETHFLQTLLFKDYLQKASQGLEHGKRCTYVIMPGSIFVTNRAFAFPVDTTIDKPINEELMSLVEAGVIQHSKTKDLPSAEVCPVDLRSTERQLFNSDLSLTYKVVVGGYVVALFVFLCELLVRLTSNCAKRGKNTVIAAPRSRKLVAKVAAKPPADLPSYLPSYLPSDLPVHATNGNISGERPSLPKRTPPSIYRNGAQSPSRGRKHCINGRDYYVVVDRDGDQRLIPIRTPSAFLFQYAA